MLRAPPRPDWRHMVAVAGIAFVLVWVTRGSGDEAARIGTLSDARGYLRALHFRNEFYAAASEAPVLLERFPHDAQLSAWYVINSARARGMRDLPAVRRAQSQAGHVDAWSSFATAAALLFASNEPGRALPHVEAALRNEPGNRDFVWLLAEAHRRTGHEDKALALLRAHTKLVNGSPELLNLRGRLTLPDRAAPRQRRAALERNAFRDFSLARSLDQANVNALVYPGLYALEAGVGERGARAYDPLRAAAQLSTGTEVHVAFWHSILRRRELTEAARRRQIERDISNVVARRGRDPELLWAISAAYRETQQKDRQREIEQAIINEFPHSYEAEQIQLRGLIDLAASDAPGGQDVGRRELRRFISRPSSRNPDATALAHVMLFRNLRQDPAVPTEELLQAITDMQAFGEYHPLEVFAGSATALADRGVHLHKAEEIARNGLRLIAARRKDALNDTLKDRVPAGEPDGSLRTLEGHMMGALGWVHVRGNRLEEAHTELAAARAALPQSAALARYRFGPI